MFLRPGWGITKFWLLPPPPQEKTMLVDQNGSLVTQNKISDYLTLYPIQYSPENYLVLLFYHFLKKKIIVRVVIRPKKILL